MALALSLDADTKAFPHCTPQPSASAGPRGCSILVQTRVWDPRILRVCCINASTQSILLHWDLLNPPACSPPRSSLPCYLPCLCLSSSLTRALRALSSYPVAGGTVPVLGGAGRGSSRPPGHGCWGTGSRSGRRLSGEPRGLLPPPKKPRSPRASRQLGRAEGARGSRVSPPKPRFRLTRPVVLPTPLSPCRLRGARSQGSSRQPLRTERCRRPRQAVRCGRMA